MATEDLDMNHQLLAALLCIKIGTQEIASGLADVEHGIGKMEALYWQSIQQAPESISRASKPTHPM